MCESSLTWTVGEKLTGSVTGAVTGRTDLVSTGNSLLRTMEHGQHCQPFSKLLWEGASLLNPVWNNTFVIYTRNELLKRIA